jgi:hypothetical protein
MTKRNSVSIVFKKNILTLVGAYPCGRPVGQAQGRAPTQKHYLKSYSSVVTGAADPTVDRVGFPEGYQDNFSIFYEFDRPDNKTARVIYANDVAASVQPGQPFPYGSILVMDVYRTPKDEAGNVLLDENGRYVRAELAGHFVMRKEPGFGTKYGELRNGEWEYVAYRADGTFQTHPKTPTAVPPVIWRLV